MGGTRKTAKFGLQKPQIDIFSVATLHLERFHSASRSPAGRCCPGELIAIVSRHSEFFSVPSLGGIRLHTLRWGDSSQPALVLLHGGGSNAHWWDHLAPALAERFYVVALDFRGHGDSDSPQSVEVGAFHRDLAALLEHLSAPDAALVGHSMGAHIALDHAAREGGSAAVAAIEPARGGKRRSRRSMRLALAARRTYRSAEEAVERFRFLPPASAASDSLRLHIARHSVRREEDGRYGFKFDPRWYTLPASERAPLGAIRCPVLILRGERSGILTGEGAAEIVAEIPGSKLARIADADHNVHIERPDAVVRAMMDFL